MTPESCVNIPKGRGLASSVTGFAGVAVSGCFIPAAYAFPHAKPKSQQRRRQPATTSDSRFIVRCAPSPASPARP
jgi:hypothetical protein